MNEDEIKGLAQDAVGKLKDGAGGLTGDPSLQAEGKIDQAAGKIQGQFGTAKEQLGAAADAVAEKTLDLASRAASTMRDAADTVRREAGHAGEKIYDKGLARRRICRPHGQGAAAAVANRRCRDRLRHWISRPFADEPVRPPRTKDEALSSLKRRTLLLV
jgi:uncharacterized protein YjbJ (UPF0337 family)